MSTTSSNNDDPIKAVHPETAVGSRKKAGGLSSDQISSPSLMSSDDSGPTITPNSDSEWTTHSTTQSDLSENDFPSSSTERMKFPSQPSDESTEYTQDEESDDTNYLEDSISRTSISSDTENDADESTEEAPDETSDSTYEDNTSDLIEYQTDPSTDTEDKTETPGPLKTYRCTTNRPETDPSFYWDGKVPEHLQNPSEPLKTKKKYISKNMTVLKPISVFGGAVALHPASYHSLVNSLLTSNRSSVFRRSTSIDIDKYCSPAQYI